MNYILKYSFFLYLLCLFSTCFSQPNDFEKLIDNESLISGQSDIVEYLTDLKQNPINLNISGWEQLSTLPWISPDLALKIINYRTDLGHFSNIYQLLEIEGIDIELLQKISEYITVGKQSESNGLQLQARSRMNTGNNQLNYLGSPNKYYNRLKMKLLPNLTIGALFEKDSGEENFNDFYAYYMKLQNNTESNKIIIGNYRLEMGQGLVFWNPYSYNKCSDTIYPAKKKSRGLVEYSLVDENTSLFGCATQICLRIYQLLIFVSNNKFDALYNKDGYINGLYDAGYHRTVNEITKKDLLNEKLAGLSFIINPKRNLKIAYTFYHSQYNPKIVSDDSIRKRYAFEGKLNYLNSFNIDYIYKNMNIFGEIAQSKNNSTAYIGSVLFNFNPVVISLLYRNYDNNFQSLHSTVFGENGGVPQNEKGFYFGLKYRYNKHLIFSLYFDNFKHPWRTYFNEMPIVGKDILLQIDHKIDNSLLLSMRIKHKLKEKSVYCINNEAYDMKILKMENKLNMRFQIEYNPTSTLRLRGRIEKCVHKLTTKSKGLLIYQDIFINITKSSKFYYRITFYDTENFESRLYQFENDLPATFSNYMLYGKGCRWYICCRFNLFFRLTASFKYAENNYRNVYETNIGNNSLQTFSVQLDTFF